MVLGAVHSSAQDSPTGPAADIESFSGDFAPTITNKMAAIWGGKRHQIRGNNRYPFGGNN